MATFVLTGLAIGKASEVIQENLRQALGGEFQVMVSYSEGKHIESTDSHVAVISKDLAEKNGHSAKPVA